jgi:hypothetical protein
MRNPTNANRGGGRELGKWIEVLEARAHFSVDLSAAVSFAAPASHQVKPGMAFAVSVAVFNNGDTVASGKLSADLSFSTSPDGSSPVGAVTGGKNIHLMPGAHVTVRVNVKVPHGFMPGTYYAVANIDPNNTFGETNLTNNTAVSTDTLTVQSLYPTVLGTFVGGGVIKKGFEKGLTFTQSVTNTSEDDATGIITFVGSDLFANGVVLSFAGQTTVKTNGSYIANGADVPADDSVFVKDIGKYIGATSKGTFKTALNSGTYDDTLEG